MKIKHLEKGQRQERGHAEIKERWFPRRLLRRTMARKNTNFIKLIPLLVKRAYGCE